MRVQTLTSGLGVENRAGGRKRLQGIGGGVQLSQIGDLATLLFKLYNTQPAAADQMLRALLAKVAPRAQVNEERGVVDFRPRDPARRAAGSSGSTVATSSS